MGDAFIDRVLLDAEEVRAVPMRLEQVIESVCSAYRLTVDELCQAGKAQPPAEARVLAALLVGNCATLSLVEPAEFLRRDLSGLSQAARRIERRMATDGFQAGKLEEAQNPVTNRTFCFNLGVTVGPGLVDGLRTHHATVSVPE